ncbi:hypothetical protein CRUP_031962 [Coryphaenoides rupestris]|nr:hypothetical protein CRUP_031962 [Coryphaenoides rupestris]
MAAVWSKVTTTTTDSSPATHLILLPIYGAVFHQHPLVTVVTLVTGFGLPVPGGWGGVSSDLITCLDKGTDFPEAEFSVLLSMRKVFSQALFQALRGLVLWSWWPGALVGVWTCRGLVLVSRGPSRGLVPVVRGPSRGLVPVARGPSRGLVLWSRWPGALVGVWSCSVEGPPWTLTLLLFLSPRSSRAQKGDGCGPSVLGPSSGTLSSLGYPGPYPNHTVCEWEIRAPRGHRLHFRFAELDIEESDCQVNYLRLYDGVGAQRSENEKFCGHGPQFKRPIVSRGNEVTVQFMGGTHLSRRGFYLSYSTTEHTDLITCLDKGTDFPEAEFSRPRCARRRYTRAWCPTWRGAASAWGSLSNSLFTFKTSGITTSGSGLREYTWYASAYRVLHSTDGLRWLAHREGNSSQDKIFQGNTNYGHEVRNNFIPPMEARYVRINPTQWHQRIALRVELLGCPVATVARPRTNRPLWPDPRGPPPPRPPAPGVTHTPPHSGHGTHTPDIRNTTMPPHTSKDVALIAVLVPVLVMALTALILTAVCAWCWKSRGELCFICPCGNSLCPPPPSSDWWKSMKQLLPSKMAERDDSSVRYSSDVGRLSRRVITPRLHAEPAEYAQPLVTGAVTTLGARSTFKPEESPAPGPAPGCYGGGNAELYDAPISPDVYHAYAEPLPASGADFMVGGGGGVGPHLMLTKTDSGGKAGRSAYDTPKSANGQAAPAGELTYQVPQNGTQKPTGQG